MNHTSGCNRLQKLSLFLPKSRQNNRHFLRRLSQELKASETYSLFIVIDGCYGIAFLRLDRPYYMWLFYPLYWHVI